MLRCERCNRRSVLPKCKNCERELYFIDVLRKAYPQEEPTEPPTELEEAHSEGWGAGYKAAEREARNRRNRRNRELVLAGVLIAVIAGLTVGAAVYSGESRGAFLLYLVPVVWFTILVLANRRELWTWESPRLEARQKRRRLAAHEKHSTRTS